MFSQSGSDQNLSSFSELSTNKHLTSQGLQTMYGGNKNKRDKVKGHEGPQRQGWCGEACIHVHLCLFVKGTKKLTAWSPPDSQVPEETASLPGPYPERFTAPADTEGPPSMLHGSPVLEAFTQSPLMMWGCYCTWPQLRRPLPTSPLSFSTAHLHPPSHSPSTKPYYPPRSPVLVSLPHIVQLCYSSFLYIFKY